MDYDSSIDAASASGKDDSGPEVDGVDPFAEPGEEAGRRRRHVLMGIGAAAVLLGVWYAGHRSHEPDFSGSQGQAAMVTVIQPGRTTVTATINATGVLAARHDMPVGSVGEGGQVSRVLVNAGDWVRAGQLLAVIDRQVQAQQLAGQQAQIGVADADARLAEANLERAQKLVARGFIAAADIDRLTATRDSALARVKVAVAQRDQIGAQIRRLDIVAPADGLVLERDVEPGQVVGAASGTLFRIAEKGEMELRAKLSENDLAHITLGQEAKVTPVGTAGSFVGHVWQVSPVIDLQTRQGLARIALAYGPGIRPGGFAAAEIQSGTTVAPLLPESALQSDTRGSFVYVVGTGNRVERRGVTTGTVTDSGIAITAGLSGRERVVLRAGAFLSPGEAVVPRLVPIAGTVGSR